MLAIIQYGLSVALVGMGTVFVGLIILIALIKLLEQVLHGMGKKEAAPAQQAVAAEAVEAVEAGAPEAAADDGELIAVIAAAVAAAMEAAGGSEQETTGFVVRSIRRINNAPAWNRAGREEQIYSRM